MSKHIVKINGESYTIPQSDLWQKPGVDKDIITHDGVRRLMLKAGITIEKVEPIVMPINGNGSRIAFLASGMNAEGRRSFAVGEADPSNLTPNTVAARYPTIMAFKRAVDRLVLDLLELFDLYSDVEFSEPTSPPRNPSPSKDAEGTAGQQHGGDGDLPPTDRQIAYLWQLGRMNNLNESEIDQLLRTVRTKAAASRLIANMRQTSA